MTATKGKTHVQTNVSYKNDSKQNTAPGINPLACLLKPPNMLSPESSDIHTWGESMTHVEPAPTFVSLYAIIFPPNVVTAHKQGSLVCRTERIMT
jgi:hypothetical protein